MYCDIIPTLVDFAGGKDPALDGRSLKELWTTKQVKNHREEILISNVHPFWQKAIVTDTYKLIWTGHPEREHVFNNFTSKSKFFAKPWAEWKDKAERDERAANKVQRVLQPKALELYDVVVDPYEINDLSNLPEHEKRIATLQAKLKKLMGGESIIQPEVTSSKQKKDKKDQRKPRKPTK